MNIVKIMSIFYNIGSIALIGISAFYGINNNMPLALLYFFASMAFLFVANIERIIKDKAPKDGLEIEAIALIKKAEVTILEMQNLAKLVSKTALSLIKRSGRMDGYPEEEQEALKESFLKLLYNLDLSDRDIENVLEEFNKFIEIDYVYLLLESHIAINWPKEELQKRREMIKNVTSICPSPERIKELLERNDSLSSVHKDILEDFRYFRKYNRYRRPEMISKYKELRKTINL
jgi:hypothetical protein